MRVHGIAITPEQIAVGKAAMVGEFTFADVRNAIWEKRIFRYEAHAIANRLIQQERKARRIEFAQGKWRRVDHG